MTVGLIFTLLLVSLNNKIARVDLTGKWLEIPCLEKLGFVPFNAQAHLTRLNKFLIGGVFKSRADDTQCFILLMTLKLNE